MQSHLSLLDLNVRLHQVSAVKPTAAAPAPPPAGARGENRVKDTLCFISVLVWFGFFCFVSLITLINFFFFKGSGSQLICFPSGEDESYEVEDRSEVKRGSEHLRHVDHLQRG